MDIGMLILKMEKLTILETMCLFKLLITFLMKKSRNICRICLAVSDLSMASYFSQLALKTLMLIE